MAVTASTTMDNDILLTTQEVAQIYRCSDAMIRVLLRRGELRALKIGDLWRIPRSEAIRYLSQRVR